MNERGAGRKKKFIFDTISKTFRFPEVCRKDIVAAVERITKPYLRQKK